MEKENKRLKILLGVLSVFAMGLCCYFAYTVYKLGNGSTKCIKEENTNNASDILNIEELNKYRKGDINIIKTEYTPNYSFNLDINGRININFLDYISNISDAKDIIIFSSPSPDEILYILTKSGDVYKFNTSNIDSGNLMATKVEEYNDIERIISYKTRKGNSGGCDYILVIDKNGKYNELDSYCV